MMLIRLHQVEVPSIALGKPIVTVELNLSGQNRVVATWVVPWSGGCDVVGCVVLGTEPVRAVFKAAVELVGEVEVLLSEWGVVRHMGIWQEDPDELLARVL